MKLNCPSNPEHKTFEVRIPVEEIWTLNSDGDVESQRDGDGAIYKEILECIPTCEKCGAVAIVGEDS